MTAYVVADMEVRYLFDGLITRRSFKVGMIIPSQGENSG